MSGAFDLASIAAPWIAALFGILAAIAAEKAFQYGNKGAAEDRWRGSDTYYDGLDRDQESDERMARACAREIAAAAQVAATYLAAGAAVEAAGASQHDAVALALAILGVICLAPIAKRAFHARDEIEWLEAWYLRGKWDVPRKSVRSQDWDEEDAEFARQHSKAARTLAKRKSNRTPAVRGGGVMGSPSDS